MDAKPILIYTDGACSGNPGPGGWGAVILFPEGEVREIGGPEPRTTNNRMELTAAIRSLETARGRAEPAVVYADSRYVIGGITGWVAGWRRRGWTTATGEAVLNRDLWERLDAAAREFGARLSWLHVRGHAGNPGNERADAIAAAFAQGQAPALFSGPLAEYGHDLSPSAAPAPQKSSKRRSGKKDGYYLSLLDGRLERHTHWEECRARVHGRSGARFRKVSTAEEETAVLRQWKAPGR